MVLVIQPNPPFPLHNQITQQQTYLKLVFNKIHKLVQNCSKTKYLAHIITNKRKLERWQATQLALEEVTTTNTFHLLEVGIKSPMCPTFTWKWVGGDALTSHVIENTLKFFFPLFLSSSPTSQPSFYRVLIMSVVRPKLILPNHLEDQC